MKKAYISPTLEEIILLNESTVAASDHTGSFEDFGHTNWSFE